ncbi:hypothetical protein COE50_06010 [Bacillus anthracis]|nr:hypothetical protein COE50_06010 [Bacillus anthracis]
MKEKDTLQKEVDLDSRLLRVISIGWLLYSMVFTYLMKLPSWYHKIDHCILTPFFVLVITFLSVKVIRKKSIIKNIQKAEKLRITLIEKLEPYIFPEYEYGIENIEEYRKNNQKAQEFLINFYKEVQNIPLRKKRDECLIYDLQMVRYKAHQERIRIAFEEKRYTTVCNELQSFTHHLPIEDPDIHANILSTLESFLGIEMK